MGIKEFDSKAPRRQSKRSDRLDGYKIKNTDYQSLVPFLMKPRDGSSIFFRENIDVTKMVHYLDRKNALLKENPNPNIKKYNYNLFFTSAIVRLFAIRYHLNRFVAGNDVFQRHSINMGYVVKKQLVDGAVTTITKSDFERYYNIEDVGEVLSSNIHDAKDESGDEVNDFLDKLCLLPNFVIAFGVWLIDKLVTWGHIPKMIYKLDPMQCSVFVSNLGSIGLDNPPVHHLYNRGTCSVFVVIGEVQKQLVDGEDKYTCGLTVTLDERISDGLYFVNSLKELRKIIQNPDQLDDRYYDYIIDED